MPKIDLDTLVASVLVEIEPPSPELVAEWYRQALADEIAAAHDDAITEDTSRVHLTDSEDAGNASKLRLRAHFVKIADQYGVAPGAWRFEARCLDLPAESIEHFFFNEGPVLNTTRRFCDGCPVRAQCLDYALDNDAYGVWAGTSRHERARMQAA